MPATRTKGTRLTPAQLQARLLHERAARNTRIGGEGERIFAECMRDGEHTVRSVHAGGIDFFVDDVVKVDVKTQLALDGKTRPNSYRPVPVKQRDPDVHYSYVVFHRDAVRLSECPRGARNRSQIELSWEEACALLDRTPRRTLSAVADPAGVRAAQRATCAELREWIAMFWGLQARVNFRGNPIAQENMARRAWGPESFYQDPRRNAEKADVVLLVYFEGAEAGAVLAYPLSRSGEITWTHKPVGPNPSGRKTFDPAHLDRKFIFADISSLKREFLRRFL